MVTNKKFSWGTWADELSSISMCSNQDNCKPSKYIWLTRFDFLFVVCQIDIRSAPIQINNKFQDIVWLKVLNIAEFQEKFCIYWWEFHMPLIQMRSTFPLTNFGHQNTCFEGFEMIENHIYQLFIWQVPIVTRLYLKTSNINHHILCLWCHVNPNWFHNSWYGIVMNCVNFGQLFINKMDW